MPRTVTRAEVARWWLIFIFFPVALAVSICRAIWAEVLVDVPREVCQFWSYRPWRKRP
jgi:hypothetical protein